MNTRSIRQWQDWSSHQPPSRWLVLLNAMPQAAAECTDTDVNRSVTISCAPTTVPNTSTDDNLTEQEVSQPGWN